MARKKLQIDSRLAIVLFLASTAWLASGCAHRNPGTGISLDFLNRGKLPLVARHFSFDGSNKVEGPGYLGPQGEGAHMAFMAGDRNHGIPEFLELEWIVYSEEYFAWSNRTPDHQKNSPANNIIYKRLWSTNPIYRQRIDLTSILTPELVAQVHADRSNTQLLMTIIFKDDQAEITAKPYTWRRSRPD